jgi:hypothetical protein
MFQVSEMFIICSIFKKSVLESSNLIRLAANFKHLYRYIFINPFISNIPLSDIINNAYIVIVSRPLYRFLYSPEGYTLYRVCFCLFLVLQPTVGQGFLIHEVSRSHTTMHHSW